MKQQTLATPADQTFENYRKPTRRDEFLKTMEAMVPWAALCEVIELRRFVDVDLGREALFVQVGQELQASAPPARSGPALRPHGAHRQRIHARQGAIK